MEINSKVEEVSRVLSPSKPIKSPEFLEGRFDEIEKIEEVLSLGGRSVFITGDRGVGKTSLAQTAAIMKTHSNYHYIYTACDPAPLGSFGGIAKDMLIKLAQLTAEHSKESIETSSGMAVVLSANPSVKFSREWSKTKNAAEIKEPEGAADVIRYLLGFGELLKKPLCVVLDELEELSDEKCKANLAHLIKQVADQEVPFKFIFSGIGSTPTELIGIHESTSRYYGAMALKPLKAQAIINIVKKASDKFGLVIPSEQLYRIATISCGYPHYPHLIGAQLIICMLKKELLQSTEAAFVDALNRAVEDSQPYLVQKYHAATFKKSIQTRDILWAFANDRNIDLSGRDVFQSYEAMRKRNKGDFRELTRQQVSTTLPHLAKPEFGEILIKTEGQSGYYRLADPLMRGFVRLKAAANGTELATDEVLQ